MNKGASVSRKPSQEKVTLIHSAGSATEARRIIAEYLKSNEGLEVGESGDSSDETADSEHPRG